MAAGYKTAAYRPRRTGACRPGSSRQVGRPASAVLSCGVARGGVIGPLDDVLVVALALRYAARQVPREVLVAAWPGEPRLLERLLGGPAPATGERMGTG